MNQARPRRHFAVNADAFAVGFARAADQRERRHGRAEDRHHQQEGSNRAAGDEEILACAAEEMF
jgi:hypothetical protein